MVHLIAGILTVVVTAIRRHYGIQRILHHILRPSCILPHRIHHIRPQSNLPMFLIHQRHIIPHNQSPLIHNRIIPLAQPQSLPVQPTSFLDLLMFFQGECDVVEERYGLFVVLVDEGIVDAECGFHVSLVFL